MLKKEWKKPLKEKDLERVSLKNLIPLILSKKITDKIEYLCSIISDVEWSGVLFYSVEGTISEFDKVKFIIEDIYLMNKGTTAYTEYELDEELIDYRMDNPESLKWKMGHIHSHHRMETYFSGTDLSELNDNSAFHNYYLSLIVNNRMELTAKVAFRGSSNEFICKNEEGKEWKLNLVKERPLMFMFDCEIQTEVKNLGVEEKFSRRVNFIIDKEERERKKEVELRKSKEAKITSTRSGTFDISEGHYNDGLGFSSGGYLGDTFDSNFEDESEDCSTLDFTRFILRFGEEESLEDNLELVIKDLANSNKDTRFDIKIYTASLMEKYAALYEKYWDEFGHTDIETFIDTTEEVILHLEEFQIGYKFLEVIITSLKMMLNRLK